MPMPKGVRYGGRQKGTPNKNTGYMKECLERKGFYVPEKLMELYNSSDDAVLKYKILELMSEYSYPKPSVLLAEPPPDEIDVENLLDQFEHVSNETLAAIANREKKLSE